MKTDKKISSIDLFAGCGGLMDGFEQSGLYTTLACVEWEKAPCDNIRKRMHDKWKYSDAQSRVLRYDIQKTDTLLNGWRDDAKYGDSDGLDSLLRGHGALDLIIGGPPCQAYSVAGRIRDENGMKNDYRNYLFESYLSVVKHYKPKAFVFENVPGILSAKPGDGKSRIIDIIRQEFKDAGYAVLDDLSDAVIDFTEYGIPQNRSRIIILGLRTAVYGENAQKLLHAFYHTILPMYKTDTVSCVRDAIGDLPKLTPLDAEIRIDGRRYSHTLPDPPVPNHFPRWHSKRDIKAFRMLADDIQSGRNEYVSADALKAFYTRLTGQKSNVHKYHVLRWDEPSNLIPAHLYKDGLRHIHPDPNQARTITVREAARLQTFPDDYVFVGSQTDQFKMIGNAVPPKFSRVLAEAVYKVLLVEDT